jgi:hypothetical protein
MSKSSYLKWIWSLTETFITTDQGGIELARIILKI